ncbi:hypothetical protein ES708_33658 [subsurface metagenome]
MEGLLKTIIDICFTSPDTGIIDQVKVQCGAEILKLIDNLCLNRREGNQQ